MGPWLALCPMLLTEIKRNGETEMSQIGLGVAIGYLGGNANTVQAYHASVGKKITSLKLEDDKLVFGFEDGTGLLAFDDGQSCCESRYPTTDDDLSSYVGSTLMSIDVKPGPEQSGEYDVHETEFLEVTTSSGHFQIVNHNEHNGYYGGFHVILQKLEP